MEITAAEANKITLKNEDKLQESRAAYQKLIMDEVLEDVFKGIKYQSEKGYRYCIMPDLSEQCGDVLYEKLESLGYTFSKTKTTSCGVEKINEKGCINW